MANSFPEKINNLSSGGMQLIGTDTRSFTNISTAKYTIPVTLSNNKSVMVELVAHSGSTITTNHTPPESSTFSINDSAAISFEPFSGTLTLPEDVMGYKMYLPSRTSVYANLIKHYFYTPPTPGTKNEMIVLSDGITITYVINHETTFTGTVTINIYQ